MHLRYFHYFQLLSLLLSIICYRRLKQARLQAFVPLLVITCIIEMLAAIEKLTPNYFLYNYYLLLTPPLYFLIFYRMLGMHGRTKWLLNGTSILIVLLVVLNYLFLQGTARFNNYSLILLSLVYISYTSLTILKTNLLDNESMDSNRAKVYFIICGSTLLFNLGMLTVLGLQTFITSNKLQVYGMSLNRFVMPILNVILYSGYSIAFLLCKRNKTLSL
jgi:hypothetical protein